MDDRRSFTRQPDHLMASCRIAHTQVSRCNVRVRRRTKPLSTRRLPPSSLQASSVDVDRWKVSIAIMALPSPSPAAPTVYFHRVCFVLLGVALLDGLIMLAVVRQAHPPLLLVALCGGLSVVHMLQAHWYRIIVSPNGMTYWCLGMYRITAPWSAVDRFVTIDVGLGPVPGVRLHDSVVTGCVFGSATSARFDRRRFIPLDRGWMHHTQLAAQIRTYAPHLRAPDATGPTTSHDTTADR